MILPGLSSGVKEGGELVGVWVDGAEVSAFGAVAVGASQGKVFEGCGATMLFRNDVFHLEGKEGNALGKAAIFAAAVGSFDDLLA